MSLKSLWRASCATAALTSMIAQPALAASKLGQAVAADPALVANAPADFADLSTAQLVRAVETTPALLAAVEAFVNSPAAPPAARKLFAAYASDPSVGPQVAHMIKQAVLRSKIKHVFIIFQENRSFDHYFGTFPGAAGPFSQPASQVLGFKQPIVNTDGTVGSVSPFVIPQTVKAVNGATVPLYPADTGSIDHSETGIDNSMDVNAATLMAANDRYALDEEGLTTNAAGQIVSTSTGLPATTPPTLAQKQMGELAVSHLDCNTIPFLWQYASAFTLFDDFHQTVIGPSTPNAIAMIAGQSGLTQWALHPGQSTGAGGKTSFGLPLSNSGVPVVADPAPFAGSNFDPAAVQPPQNVNDESPASPAITQTYASLPLSFMGNKIKQVLSADQNPTLDLADIQDDIRTIAGENLPPTNWAWYQLGYDLEPLDPTNNTGGNPHYDYITHHNGPQYFGYLGDNTTVQKKHLFGQAKFYTDLAGGTLPNKGVFYIRGGYDNIDGLKPVDPNPALAGVFPGNDDHPGYSDAQISEASVADTVNAIAASPYWKDSAIVITYDETDGLYDDHQVNIRTKDPEGNYIEAGPRIPAIVISPFSRAHVVIHQYSEHSSVIKFIDELFGLLPLADLPDEVAGRILGQSETGQSTLTPADDVIANIGDLFPAFSDARLLGLAAPLPASVAEIPAAAVHTLPHYNGAGCQALGITPVDYPNGLDAAPIDPPPADFNPRPSSNPGIPTSGTWTP